MQLQRVRDNTYEVVGCGCFFGGDTESLAQASGQILHVLMATYPGHHLKVHGYKSVDKNGIGRPVFHIVHLDFDQTGSNWGMALHGNRFYSSSQMQKEVVTMFGEWLERAYLKRGAATGEEVSRVDGIPDKNHANHRKEIDVQQLIDAGMKAAQENPNLLAEKQERIEPWRLTG